VGVVPASGDSSDTQVIFNDAGLLDGDPGLTYDKAIARLTVGGFINIWKGNLQDNTSTAVGSTALAATIAGATNNTAVGYRAMYRATTGTRNVAVGANAIAAIAMAGNDNTAVGYNSLTANVAVGNTGVGSNAGASISSGQYNTALGIGAMANGLITGNDNVGVGGNALASNRGTVSGTGNVGVGVNAGVGLTTGSQNIFVGNGSGLSAVAITGNDNVGIGRDTFRNLSSGSDNVGSWKISVKRNYHWRIQCRNWIWRVRQQPDRKQLRCSRRIRSGKLSCWRTDRSRNPMPFLANTSGGNNTAVGFEALRTVISNSNNTALGYQAARATTASDTTAIGSNALALSTGGDSQRSGWIKLSRICHS